MNDGVSQRSEQSLRDLIIKGQLEYARREYEKQNGQPPDLETVSGYRKVLGACFELGTNSAAVLFWLYVLEFAGLAAILLWR